MDPNVSEIPLPAPCGLPYGRMISYDAWDGWRGSSGSRTRFHWVSASHAAHTTGPRSVYLDMCFENIGFQPSCAALHPFFLCSNRTYFGRELSPRFVTSRCRQPYRIMSHICTTRMLFMRGSTGRCRQHGSRTRMRQVTAVSSRQVDRPATCRRADKATATGMQVMPGSHHVGHLGRCLTVAAPAASEARCLFIPSRLRRLNSV